MQSRLSRITLARGLVRSALTFDSPEPGFGNASGGPLGGACLQWLGLLV